MAEARKTRKLVTVLFCDVTGSTALGEELDSESLRNVMERYFDIARKVVESHGGTVEKFIGDAVMAVFGVPVVHEDDELFEGIPSPFTAMRYHSLVVERQSLPADLLVTAWSGNQPQRREIMAMKHRAYPVYGVQFHPESIGTDHGMRLIKNFLQVARAAN